jgi:hypothetical protein
VTTLLTNESVVLPKRFKASLAKVPISMPFVDVPLERRYLTVVAIMKDGR